MDYNFNHTPNGKRGRNHIYGKKLSIKELEYEKNGDYYRATKLFRTRLFIGLLAIIGNYMVRTE